MSKDDPLLSAKELAKKLARHPTYIWAAAKKGLPNVAGRYDYQSSTRWLSKHPRPRGR
jgi:hypothetical protein